MTVGLTTPKGSAFTREEFVRCQRDPVYFVDAYCQTFDPRRSPYRFDFRLYGYQKDAVLWIVDHVENGRDGLIEKSRDMGITWLVICVIVWFWLFRPGFQALIGSRKEDYVDNGTLESLFPKAEYVVDALPFAPEGFQMKTHRTRMKLVNPMNGNIISGESSNPKFGRGGRYTVALFDEGAFWDDVQSAWASCGDSTRCRLMVTTPPERTNFSKYIRFSGKTDVLTLHWKLHPLKDQAWYEAEIARRTPEEVSREIDINWEGSITGRVYPEVGHVRVGSFPYRPDWPLYVSHDPGHRPDPWALGWFQRNPDTDRYRLVEAHEAFGKVADWWLPFFGRPIDSQFAYAPDEITVMGVTGEWKAGIHVGDPAGNQGNAASGWSPYEALAKAGIHVQTNSKANDYDARKVYAARVLQRLDVNDTPGTRLFMESIKASRYPDLSETSSRTTPNLKPVHDWSSHNRSMLEYFSVNVERFERREEEDSMAGTFMEALADVQSRHTNDY